MEILNNLELKVTPPNEFNDPFEFTPHVVCSSPNRKLKSLLRDKVEIKEWYLEHKQNGYKGNFREFRNQLNKARPELLANITPKMPEVNTYLRTTFLERVSKDYGLLCMSMNPSSLVMWGHYCDKYRGIVIGFDGEWSIFKNKIGLRPVRYVKERVKWDSSWRTGSNEELLFTEHLIYSKNAEWSYEYELRQLFTLSGLKHKNLANGTSGYFLPIPPEIITSVYLGFRCSKELERKVHAALQKHQLSSVQVYHATLHENAFALKYETIFKTQQEER